MKNGILKGIVGGGFLFSSCLAYAVPVTLAPIVAGMFSNGDGVNSDWVQVNRNWRGLSYSDVGSPYYGTKGINELRDQAAVMAMDRGLLGIDQGLYSTWTGTVANVNFADKVFNDVWGSGWGARPLAPVLKDDYQENFAVRMNGYLAIPLAGEYNFGVLFDDGFRFELLGHGGASVALSKDGLNPPWDIASFADPLLLGAGLYGFNLDSYEHWEAGVISLLWQSNNSGWSVVPDDRFFTQISEPGTWGMLLVGLMAMRRRLACGSATRSPSAHHG